MYFFFNQENRKENAYEREKEAVHEVRATDQFCLERCKRLSVEAQNQPRTTHG